VTSHRNLDLPPLPPCTTRDVQAYIVIDEAVYATEVRNYCATETAKKLAIILSLETTCRLGSKNRNTVRHPKNHWPLLLLFS
jgi:hypothetical protein